MKSAKRMPGEGALLKAALRPTVLRRLSGSLIRDSHLFLFDTEGGKRLTQFCALSACPEEDIAESECLNLYNLETHRSQASIFSGKCQQLNFPRLNYSNSHIPHLYSQMALLHLAPLHQSFDRISSFPLEIGCLFSCC